MANYNLELWSSEFASNLFETKDWYSVGKNLSANVYGNLVHIPQAAAAGSSVRIDGSTVLPIAASAKTFQDLTFDVHILAANPRYVNIDQAQANTFEGRTKLTEDMLAELKQLVNMEIAYGWQPAAAALATTGTATRANIYGKASCKRLTFADVLAARTKLAVDKSNMDSLYLVVDPIMYSDLLSMAEFKAASELGDNVTVSGYVGQVAGFKVIERTLGLAYTAAGAKPVAIEADDSYANTHFSAALAFDASKVAYAYAGTTLGVKEYETGYYGDVMQAHTRVGASPLRADGKGIVAIIEAV